MRADVLLTNGLIHTMDRGRTVAGSLAFANGRIVAVDASVDAKRTVDLGGRVVVPGFHDAHNHMAMFGIRLGEIDLRFPAVRNLDEVYQRIAERVDMASPGEWIVGSSYDQNKLGGAHPVLDTLDAIAPDNPVWLKHTSGHMAVVNSCLLQRTDVANCPPGGVVQVDSDGRPTGLLQEQAQQLVQDLVRPYPLPTLIDALGEASVRYAAEGLTGVTEAGIGGGWVGHSPVEAAAFSDAASSGLLRQRVTLMPVSDVLHETPPGSNELGLDLGIRTGFGDDRVRIGAMKVFSDGSLIGRTAAMCCGFADDVDNVGFLQSDVDELARTIRGAHRSGWQVAVHAIGDRAVSTTIDILAAALAERPRADHRHRIEHCGVCRPEDVQRMADLGVIAVPQGRFVAEIGDGMAAALGDQRVPWCYRAQSFLDAGVPLAASSDRPVVLGAPLLGIEAMVTRRTESGAVLAPQERLSPIDALAAYTNGSTFANFSDGRCGSLEVGKYADLVVLGADPLSVDPDAIGSIDVLATVVGGDVVFGEW